MTTYGYSWKVGIPLRSASSTSWSLQMCVSQGPISISTDIKIVWIFSSRCVKSSFGPKPCKVILLEACTHIHKGFILLMCIRADVMIIRMMYCHARSWCCANHPESIVFMVPKVLPLQSCQADFECQTCGLYELRRTCLTQTQKLVNIRPWPLVYMLLHAWSAKHTLE